MRAIRRTNTKPEIALRSALHRGGYRFRKDLRLDLNEGARVRPDIAFTGRRVAVFVDGCFWHACPEHGRDPAVNQWYWAPKLRRTVERDRAADAALAAAGGRGGGSSGSGSRGLAGGRWRPSRGGWGGGGVRRRYAAGRVHRWHTLITGRAAFAFRRVSRLWPCLESSCACTCRRR